MAEREIPKLYNDKSECCGCTACMVVCGVNAIYMQTDSEGFKYPYIQEDKCVKCYRCIQVCPFKNE